MFETETNLNALTTMIASVILTTGLFPTANNVDIKQANSLKFYRATAENKTRL